MTTVKFPLVFTEHSPNVWECYDAEGMYLFETNEVGGKLMEELVNSANNSETSPLEIELTDNYEV